MRGQGSHVAGRMIADLRRGDGQCQQEWGLLAWSRWRISSFLGTGILCAKRCIVLNTLLCIDGDVLLDAICFTVQSQWTRPASARSPDKSIPFRAEA